MYPDSFVLCLTSMTVAESDSYPKTDISNFICGTESLSSYVARRIRSFEISNDPEAGA